MSGELSKEQQAVFDRIASRWGNEKLAKSINVPKFVKEFDAQMKKVDKLAADSSMLAKITEKLIRQTERREKIDAKIATKLASKTIDHVKALKEVKSYSDRSQEIANALRIQAAKEAREETEEINAEIKKLNDRLGLIQQTAQQMDHLCGNMHVSLHSLSLELTKEILASERLEVAAKNCVKTGTMGTNVRGLNEVLFRASNFR